MTAPLVSCPACHADEVAVMPSVSLEMFWSRSSDQGACNGTLTAELHLCPRCGHVSLFATNPAAAVANFGSLLSMRKTRTEPYR